MTVLAAHSLGETHRLLIAYEHSPAVVWDLRWANPTSLNRPLPGTCASTSKQTSISLPSAASLTFTMACVCRYQCVVARAGSSRGASAAPDADEDRRHEDDGGVTAACWVGHRGDCFATGHESGMIRIWGIPEAAAGVVVTSPRACM